jgi:hypothetical protein
MDININGETCGIVLLSTTTYSAQRGRYAISVTPEVAPIEKKKPKRSAKPKSEQPQNPGNFAIETQPAPESAPILNGTEKIDLKTGETYPWDRTGAEAAEQAEQVRISKTAFPVPKDTTLPFAELCDYYNGLRELPVGRYARLYVARWWPVLLPVETFDDFGNLKESFPNDVKITAEDGPLSQQLLLQLAGVGEYRFRLNDSRRPWKQQTLVFSELELIDPSLWTLHPPIIDPKRLDFEAKRNQAYIKFARAHGYLPHEGAEQKEQSDMANEQIVSQLLNQNKQLTDQVISTKPAAAPAPTPPPKSENGDGSAMKAVVDLATAALNRPAPPVAPGADPMVMVRGMVDIIKEIKPAPDTSATDLAKQVVTQAESANTRIYELQKEQMKDMRAELDRMRTAAVVTPPAPPTLAQQFQDMEALMGAAKRLTGRGGSTAEEEDKPDKLDKYVALLSAGAPIIGQIVQGIFQTGQMFIQTWGIVSYNNSLAKNGAAEPKPPTTMEKQTEPGKPVPPQGPPPTPEQQAQAQQMPLILAAVSQIIGPLQRALNNSKTGDEFAESMIDFTSDGRADYDRVRNVAETLIRLGMQVPGQPGVEQFKNAAAYLFQQFPAFWQKVGPLPTFGAFLEEFYDYDRIAAQKQQEESK